VKNLVVFTDLGPVIDHGMRADFCTLPNTDMVTDYRVRTNLNAFGQVCSFMNDRAWMYHGFSPDIVMDDNLFETDITLLNLQKLL
jgi:hypothetical protein